MSTLKIGNGFDVHSFTDNRPLILGGVDIDYHRGLAGHSDADVLTHAIIDSLTGPSGLGDIGRLFPDTDEAYRGISSLELLERVSRKLQEIGIRVINCDSVVLCEKPRIAPYIEAMSRNIAGILRIVPSCVSIKGTTTEGLGFTGRGEGIAVYAVSLLEVS